MCRGRKVWMKRMKGTRRESVGILKRKKGLDDKDERDDARECGKCEEEKR